MFSEISEEPLQESFILRFCFPVIPLSFSIGCLYYVRAGVLV